MLIEFCIYLCFHISLRHFIDFLTNRLLSAVCVIYTHINTITGLRYLLTHLFVQAGYNHIPVTVTTIIIGSFRRNRCSFGHTHTKYIHLNTFLGSSFGSFYRTTFMVFTISYDNHRTPYTFLRRKTAGG